MPKISVADFTALILRNLPYRATSNQQEAAKLISEFIFRPATEHSKPLFLLRGYAGTGKTSLLAAIVNSLPAIGIRSSLLAPTGRAAKVMAGYSGKPAFTIHRKIYIQHSNKSGIPVFKLRKNLHTSALFVVDEASMITNEYDNSEESFFRGHRLLSDLIEFVYSANCRLLLSGDTAQLPPVGTEISPALNTPLLKASFPVEIFEYELTEVVRQDKKSGILLNATSLRNKISTGNHSFPLFSLSGIRDVIRVNGSELEELLNTNLHHESAENTVIITRSNKRAVLYNQEVRRRILFREAMVSAGDLMMVVKNNYFWLPEGSDTGFIANGEMFEVMRIGKHEELYGFKFCDATIRLVDYENQPLLEVKLLLDTLLSDSPSLSYEQNRQLFSEVMADYEEIRNRSERMKLARKNAWLNALQVKYAYALTCHKTQGGQWKHVFIDAAFLRGADADRESLRWLYTAITRSAGKVYLVNFADSLFGTN